MSSVTSSRRNEEAIANNRDEYKRKESELKKTHQKTVRRLREDHRTEVTGLRTQHNEKINTINSNANNIIAKRDLKHKNEIENLKQLNSQKIRKSATENKSTVSRSSKSNKQALNNVKKSYDDRINRLNTDFSRQIEQENSDHSSSIKILRKKQNDSLKKRTVNLESKHKTEMVAIRKHTNNKISDLQGSLSEQKEYSKFKENMSETNNLREKNRMSENFKGQIVREREAFGRKEGMLRDGFKDGLDKVRDRFDKRYKKDAEVRNKNHKALRKSLDTRVFDKQKSLENKIADLELENSTLQVEQKRKTDTQVKNVSNDMSKNLKSLRDESEQNYEVLKERRSKDLNSQRKELGKISTLNQKKLMNKNYIENEQNKSAIQSMKTNYASSNQQAKDSYDSRVKNLLEKSNTEKSELHDNYTSNLEKLKTSNNIEKKEMASDLRKTHAAALNRIKQRAMDVEINLVAKQDREVTELKNQIIRLKKDNSLQKREMTHKGRQVVSKLIEDNEDRLKAVTSQNNEKLEETRVGHRSEVDSLNRRHQSEINNLISATKNA